MDRKRRPRRIQLDACSCGRYERHDHSDLIGFRAAGRYFQVHVLLARRATERTRELAVRVLDSVVVRSR